MSLIAATAQAVAFLTRSLHLAYSLPTVEAARSALMTTLSAHFATSWDEHRPTSGTGRRCLTLSAGTPPKPVYLAAGRACVAWARWFETLGGAEFNLFVDPGCVRVRAQGSDVVVWSAAQEELRASEAALKDGLRAALGGSLLSKLSSGTRARAARSISLDTENLPAPVSRSHSPASSISSGRSSLFSAVSAASAATSIFSAVEPKTNLVKAAPKPIAPQGVYQMSRRERERQRRRNISVVPDAAPAEYDGGKTTVLGGGVRLGCAMAQPRAIACL
jgi:hypothetical protein